MDVRERTIARSSAALVITLLIAAMAHAENRHVTIGTLMCTSEDITTAPPAVKRTIECRFAPGGAGRPVKLTGTLLQAAGEGVPPGLRVMIWSVLAPSSETAADALQGRYASPPPAMAATAGRILLGGANGDIALQPMTPSPQTGVDSKTEIDLVLSQERT